MSLTGLFLISFLVVHCSINGLIFFNDHGQLFNRVAGFMGTNYIIHILEVGLFLGIILHIIQAYILYVNNKKARRVRYVVKHASANSRWYSRSMTLLGTLILIFLIIHLRNFWFPNRFVGISKDPAGNADLFSDMVEEFQSPWLVIVYLLAVFSLSWHLLQGFQSAFQTLGLNHKKYTPFLRGVGIAFSIIVPLIFASMPVSIYFGWIQ